jgi:hypothetical protein
MDVTGGAPHPFRLMARVPEDMISLPTDGQWAAWLGLASAPQDASQDGSEDAAKGGRDAAILVSITVTAFDPPPRVPPGEVLAAMLRARHPDGSAPNASALIEEFSTPDGNPAVGLRLISTQEIRGQAVTTGQAQALVVFAGCGALAVVSGVCLHPDDLDRAAVLVAGIAARITVTAATLAA